MAVVRKIPCVVRTVTDHGEHVYTVELQPSMPVPQFRPGQFLHLALDPYEPGGFWPESRVFSIASSPAERDRLAITYAVKGAFTTRMERELAAGGRAWVKLPYGEFVVDPARDAVLFAGGTGITAFTAFLADARTRAGPKRRCCTTGPGSRTCSSTGHSPEARGRGGRGSTCNLVCEGPWTAGLDWSGWADDR